jgi:hypothetical protein
VIGGFEGRAVDVGVPVRDDQPVSPAALRALEGGSVLEALDVAAREDPRPSPTASLWPSRSPALEGLPSAQREAALVLLGYGMGVLTCSVLVASVDEPLPAGLTKDLTLMVMNLTGLTRPAALLIAQRVVEAMLRARVSGLEPGRAGFQALRETGVLA